MYFAIIFFLLFLVPGPVAGWNIKKGNSPYNTILYCVIISILGVIAVFAAAGIGGMPLGQQFLSGTEYAAGTIASNPELAEQIGLSDLSYDDRIKFLTSFYGMLNPLFPSLIIITSTVISYFSYMMISKAFNGKGSHSFRLTPLKNFAWPQNLIFGFIITFILSWIAGAVPVFQGAQLYGNMAIIFEFTMAVQGLAVVFFFVDAKKIPKIIAIITGIFIFVSNIGRLILFCIGILDFIINLRKRISRK